MTQQAQLQTSRGTAVVTGALNGMEDIFSVHPLSRADGGRKQTIICTEQVVLSKRFFSNISFQSRRHKTRGRAHDFRDRE